MSAEAVTEPTVEIRWRDFVDLTKPRLNVMVVLTTLVGFLLASPDGVHGWTLLATLVGTGLLACGASALNQVLEADVDARMRRTADRPLPAGRLDTETALVFGAALCIAGMLLLAFGVHFLAAMLGAMTLAGYVFVYTPMKRKSTLATIAGAVPGALPPMMGYAAAAGRIDAVAWALFGILFLWQIPHFLSIAWMYRDDYRRGGLKMLTDGDETGERTARQMVLYIAALLPVSLLPSVLGISGTLYLAGAVVLNGGFLAAAVAFGLAHSVRSARQVMLVSLTYLPLVLILMVANQAA